MTPRSLTRVAVAALLVGAMAGPAGAHDGSNVETIPMQKGKVKLAGGEKPKVTLAGSWKGETPSVSPFEELVSLRVFGGFKGDSGALRLDSGKWEQTKKGWRYDDDGGSVGGIELVDLRFTKAGGKLKVKGGGSKWLYEAKPGVTPNPLTATLQIGIHQWCVQFQAPKLKKDDVTAKTRVAPTVYDSTWAGVQGIFDRNGCLSPLCHGAAPGQGNLDLRPEVAYEQLVNRSSVLGGKLLVKPGSRQDSFLWEKLAAATEGYDLDGRGSPMPSGGAPITPAELEAIRLWIQFGAPNTGVVGGTEEVLGGCLPPAEPQKAEPAEPPAEGTGLQFHAPPWTIEPANGSGLNGEGEVCYATWFDVREQVPDEFETPCPEFWGGPTKTCFFWNRTELTQDPNSHHSIIHIYKGEYEPTWQPSGPGGTTGFKFMCHGGANDGQACDPRVANVCGDGASCYGDVVSSVACIGYGPPDYGNGIPGTGGPGSGNSPSVGGSQQPYSNNTLPAGVFGVYPIEGVIVWNSHAFNLFETPVTNEQWWNVYFAPAEDRDIPMRPIFDANDIFWCPPGQFICDTSNVPPFTEREFCRTVTFAKGTRIFEFSSHTHERGRLFRIWGPGIAQSCEAAGPVPCEPEPTAPFFITTEYNDPTVLNRNDDPWVLDSDDPAQRRFKFCSIYDNGFTNPLEVKRNSTSPVPPPPFYDLAPGGRCYFSLGNTVDLGISCLTGPKKGQLCRGEAAAWNGDHSVCDSSPDKGDGVCDACPLTGGLTTDDEMFILLGSYYCVPGSDCETQPYTN